MPIPIVVTNPLQAAQTTTIRRLHPDEAEGLAPLLDSAGYPATSEQLLGRVERITADPAYGIWGAFAGDRIVAVTAATLLWPLEADDPVVQILAVVTHPEHRRQGVASALMAEVERWAREHRAGILAVINGTLRGSARGFYERHGFAETGNRLEKWL